MFIGPSYSLIMHFLIRVDYANVEVSSSSIELDHLSSVKHSVVVECKQVP